MDQKATVRFDAQAGTLTIAGELMPHSPQVHDLLVDLVGGGMASLDGDGGFDVNSNIVTYSFTFRKRKRKRKPAPEPKGLPSAADLDAVANESGEPK